MTTKRLNIGQFITQYPYEDQFSEAANYFCSGAERVAKKLSNELTKLGCNVTVCTSSATSKYTVEEQGNLTVERSPSLTSVNSTQIAPRQVIDPITKRRKFDIVHAHNSTPPGVIAGWLCAKWNDIPLVITHHGGENYEPHGTLLRRAGLFAYTRFLINPLFRSADVAVSPTEGYIKESSALSSAETVTVIPNGVDTTEFDIGLSSRDTKRRLGIEPESFLVLYVGSLRPRKGVDVLLEGFLQFHESYPETKLVIGGDGVFKEQLTSMVKKRCVAETVSIPGFIPESEKPLYMNAADAFILPSVTPGAEVFPLVLLEAAAAQTPIIASRFDTIESVIRPNDIGTFLEPGNPDSVATELTRLYEDKRRRQEMSENAVRMAREREWAMIAEQYLDLYERLVE